MAQISDAGHADVADRTTVFAKLTPAQKERVVRALHAKGHVVVSWVMGSTTARR